MPLPSIGDEKYCHPCREQEIEKVSRCPLQCRQPQCKAYPRRRAPADLTGKHIVWVTAGPGWKKSPVCNHIADKYNLTLLSTTQLILEDIKKDGVTSFCLKSVMARGELVPNDIVVNLLKTAVDTTDMEGTNGFVIQGYPREKRQGHLFDAKIGPVSMLLYFKNNPETLANYLRALPKLSCPFQNKEDTIKAKLKVFFDEQQKIMDLYPHRLVTINAEQEQTAMLAAVDNVLDRLIVKGLTAYKAGSHMM